MKIAPNPSQPQIKPEHFTSTVDWYRPRKDVRIDYFSGRLVKAKEGSKDRQNLSILIRFKTLSVTVFTNFEVMSLMLLKIP